MTKTAHEYAKEFSGKHPEIGAMDAGEKVSPNGMREFAGLITGAVKAIEHKGLIGHIHDGHKEGASRDERFFVRSAADMATRTFFSELQDNPALLDDEVVGTAARRIMRRSYMAADASLRETIARETEQGIKPDSLHRALEVVHGADPSDPESFHANSTNLAEIAHASLDGLARLTELNDGFSVSQYEAGNLQNLIGEYERIEPGLQAA